MQAFVKLISLNFYYDMFAFQILNYFAKLDLTILKISLFFAIKIVKSIGDIFY